MRERDGWPIFIGKSVSVSEGGEQIGKFSQHDLLFQNVSINLGRIVMFY